MDEFEFGSVLSSTTTELAALDHRKSRVSKHYAGSQVSDRSPLVYLLPLPLCAGSLFYGVGLSFLSSSAIIFLMKSELFALCGCLCYVTFFLTVLCLQLHSVKCYFLPLVSETETTKTDPYFIGMYWSDINYFK